MLSNKTVSIGLLLIANALLVVLLIVASNQWWWQKLDDLDSQIKAVSQSSETSNAALLKLVNSQLPLKELLADSAFKTQAFMVELEFLVFDSSRDYDKILQIKESLLKIKSDIESAWPDSMDAKLLGLYKENAEIIIDIINEVLGTSSPIQLQRLMEDSEDIFNNLNEVKSEIAFRNYWLFEVATDRVVYATQDSKKHILELENTSSQIIHRSIVFMVFCTLLILLLQWSLYYIIRKRLSGLVHTMMAITEKGHLHERVLTENRNDLIGNIGHIFNLMMSRLEMSQKLLQEQKERAESATQAKSDFLANMSHEIRTPVHAITGLIYLMREQQLTPTLSGYIDKADTASEALVHIINDVLDFSKISAGKIELENKPFELLPSLEKHIDLFSSKFNLKQLDFALLIDKSVPRRVVGDDLRLNQILINLINNALKFTHSGSVQLKVRCTFQSESDVFLTFIVEDTGVGIEEGRIPTLFDAFYQGDVSTTRKYGGTGLGLAISQKLSELMEGWIQVKSKVDRGSVFTLNVKLGIDTDIEQLVFPLLPEKKATTDILCVCSRGSQSTMMMSMLTTMGFSVVFVETLKQAQDLLSKSSSMYEFGMALIDIPLQLSLTHKLLIDSIAEYNLLLTIPIAFIAEVKKEVDTVTVIQIIERPIKPSKLFNAIMSTLGYPKELQLSSDNSGIEDFKRRQLNQIKVGGAKVLIVEDVVINQQILSEILVSGGVRIQLADNGKQAVEILEDECFDLILMDLQMPVMGGVEATKFIRQQLKIEKLPIIAITANTMKGVIDECKEAGFNDYLSKPLDVNQLWDVLGLWIAPAERAFLPISDHNNESMDDVSFLQNQTLGIDLILGLERVNGNKTLYCSLLSDFSNEFSGSYTQLKRYLDNKEYANLAQLAHAIKGVSANLGMYLLSKISYAIEKQAKRLIGCSEVDLMKEIQDSDDLLEILQPYLIKLKTVYLKLLFIFYL